jgi:hypothetical protein
MGQYVVALGLGLKALESAAPEASAAGHQLRHLRGLTEVIGTEVHDLALEIRPTALDDLGLSAALGTYAEDWTGRTGIRVDYQTAGVGGDRLPPAVETASSARPGAWSPSSRTTARASTRPRPPNPVAGSACWACASGWNWWTGT